MIDTKGLGLEKDLEAKKVSRGKILGIIGSVVSAASIAVGIHFAVRQDTTAPLDMSLVDLSVDIAQPFRSLVARPSLMVGGTNVLPLTRNQRSQVISARLSEKRETAVMAAYGEHVQETTLGELGLQLTDYMENILDRIEEMEAGLFNLYAWERQLPAAYGLEFQVPEENIYNWTAHWAGHLNVAPVEPSLQMASRGNFQVISGQAGSRIDTERFVQDALVAINSEQTDQPIQLVSHEVAPRFDESALAGVDTRVASFSTEFVTGIGRSHNVARGAEIISGHVIMPGETFDYNSTFPVDINAASGFALATIFSGGRIVEDFGGGLCQVSSTLYGAVLRMGIIPSLASAHSGRVDYVPGGLDACMWNQPGDRCNVIFTNPYDVPIYLSAFTNGGTLTVEFWSTADVLGGYTHTPVSSMIASGPGTETWNSWLRTYRGSELVREQFLRQDFYRIYTR